MSDRAREVDVAMSRQLARVMDDAVTIPGTRIGLGLDAVIGLVPVVGDAVGSALSSVIVRDAIRARVPMVVLAVMGLNLVVDAVLGFVPGSVTCSTSPTGRTARTSGCCFGRWSVSRCVSRPLRSMSRVPWH